MLYSDLVSLFQWWMAFFIIGVFFLPLALRIFRQFSDLGYIFAKIIGIAILSYIIFVFGILHIVPFNQVNTLVILIFLGIVNLFFNKTNIFNVLKTKWRVFFFEELLFTAALFFWSFVREHQPEIHGLEKYMDFGFVNSILRSSYFPSKDMWFTPFPINYYYFGHLVTAVLTKLSGIPSFITYNLMLSTLFACTFVCSFSIALNLYHSFNQRLRSAFICGLLTAFLVSFAGNLHTIYSFFKPYAVENPLPFWQLPLSIESFPNSYWYPNATRFIYNTIHEFPMYSFVVSDLHGHVLDIPFVLLTIALLLSLIFKSSKFLNFENLNLFGNWKLEIGNLLLLSFLIAIMYMTNAWDGIIYFLLTALVFFALYMRNKFLTSASQFQFTISNLLFPIFFVCIGSILFSLPFSLHFKPFVSGIGVLCAPQFLTKIGHFGPFLFEPNHCQKSPLWQLFILYGFFYFWVMAFLVSIRSKLNVKRYDLDASSLLVFLLIFLSTLLIIIPEFIYVKDIYPAHYRANTMFKLVYESFIMLSIASGYIIMRMSAHFKSLYWIIGIIGLFLVLRYPFFAIDSFYGNLKTYQGLDGTAYLKNFYSSDYQAILWINKNITGQPVILEAQGDSYTDFARVSANTGLPTVLGWTVHEWLWRGTYSIPAPRISEVQTMYENSDIEATEKLMKKYNVSLVFVGDLERQKYPLLHEEKFKLLGKPIFHSSKTTLYQIINS